MSDRAARRRRQRAQRAQGSGSRREETSRFNPRLITILSALVALALIAGVWYTNRDGGGSGLGAGTQADADTVLANALTLGSPDAPVEVVTFGDYKCPACKMYEEGVFPQLHRQYIEPGLVRYKHLQYPFLAPDSITAAIATRAVQVQDAEAAWAFHDALFENQGDQSREWATPDFLRNLARQVAPHLDHERFSQDMGDNEVSGAVRQELNYGRSLGVNATPTVFVDGQMTERPGWSNVQSAIDAALAAAEEAKVGNNESQVEEADGDQSAGEQDADDD